MKLGRGTITVRGTNHPMLCRVCDQPMVVGDVSVTIEDLNAHRICLKMWLEYTLDVMPISKHEMNMDPTGNTARVETERSRREFSEYRQALVERYR